MFNTPGGNTSAIFSMSRVAEEGVCSAGFNTTQFPVARAGGNFHESINSGKFQGIICPTTPSGSFIFKDKVFWSSSEAVPSSALMHAAKYLQ